MVVLPTTKLEAVNVMLDVITESAVTALGENPDATNAETLLDEISRRVQSKGWTFNTVTMDLTADGSGFVVLPINTMRFDWHRSHCDDPDLVYRQLTGGGDIQAYDRTDNTNVFTVGRVFKDAVIIQAQEFDQLPESARQFIMISAARTFQDRSIGASARARFTREDELRAEADLKREEAQSGDYTIFQTGIPRNIRRRNSYFNRYY